jgi:phospholipid transport system transporter-binding protein
VSETRVTQDGAGRFAVAGPLTFDTVHGLLALPTMEAQESITIDLAGVPRADSAGLALMLEWLRQARHNNRTLTFTHIPARLQDLIDVSGLSALFAEHRA